MLLLFVGLFSPTIFPAPATVVVQVNGLQTDKGPLNLALFPVGSSFPEVIDDNAYTARIPVSAMSMTHRFTELPHGQYALAIYQDVNNNGKLDKNMMGVPQEPYAFSSGAIAKWRAPTFADAAFTVDQAEVELSLRVKRWAEW